MFWTFWLLVLFTSHSTDSYKRNKNKIGLASETRPYLSGFKKRENFKSYYKWSTNFSTLEIQITDFGDNGKHILFIGNHSQKGRNCRSEWPIFVHDCCLHPEYSDSLVRSTVTAKQLRVS